MRLHGAILDTAIAIIVTLYLWLALFSLAVESPWVDPVMDGGRNWVRIGGI